MPETAVRLGARVAHQRSGTLTNGDVLTMCGRTLSPTDSRFTEVDIETVPLHLHCLKCWG